MSLDEERAAEAAAASEETRRKASQRSGGIVQFAVKACILAVVISASALYVAQLNHR